VRQPHDPVDIEAARAAKLLFECPFAGFEFRDIGFVLHWDRFDEPPEPLVTVA